MDVASAPLRFGPCMEILAHSVIFPMTPDGYNCVPKLPGVSSSQTYPPLFVAEDQFAPNVLPVVLSLHSAPVRRPRSSSGEFYDRFR
jgi:hypothetical protein